MKLKLWVLFPLMIFCVQLSAQSQKQIFFTKCKSNCSPFLDLLPNNGDVIFLKKSPTKNDRVIGKVKVDEDDKIYASELGTSLTTAIRPGHTLIGPYVIIKTTENLNHEQIERLHHQYNGRLVRLFLDKELSIASFTQSSFHKYQTNPRSVELVRKVFTEQVDQKYLKEKLKEYTGEISVSIGGRQVKITERGSANGRKNARKYLIQEFKKLGFSTSEHEYSASGANVVAVKKGSSNTNKFIVASAHLDSVHNAGADDDGTGVVGLLAIAKVFAKLKHSFNLHLVVFDEEEKGLIGSGHYIRRLASEGKVQNLVGAIHNDMTGFDSNDDGKFHVLHCKENSSKAISDLILKHIADQSIDLKNVPACRRRSDHIRYWQYQRPAVMLIEIRQGDSDVNPHYHRSSDTVKTLNLNYFHKIIKASVLSLATMAQVKP